MHAFETAWQREDLPQIAARYAPNGRILPAKRVAVEGPDAIAAFFAGGVAKVLLQFVPQQRFESATVVFEAGICRDLDRASGTLRESCHYAVAWTHDGSHWLIQSHGWGAGF